MSLRISRQHWQGLLAALDEARRQRHLLTYRSLIERLQLPVVNAAVMSGLTGTSALPLVSAERATTPL